MSVPLFLAQRQHSPLRDQLNAKFSEVLDSGHYILGEEAERFEEELAASVGVPYAIGVSSGTDALLVGLMALGVGPGDEVICPSFTFFSTASCIVRLGATPVFVDACTRCFNITAKHIKPAITPKTKAIIPVHLYGQCAPMGDILALAEQHNIAILEDVAQAQGADYKGRKAGSMGDLGAFSFFPTKNLGCLGDAGAVTCHSKELYEKIKRLRMHGMEPKYYHHEVGGNFRIDALQAALLRIKLPHTEEFIQKRRANAAYYTEQLLKTEAFGLENDANAWITLPEAVKDHGHTYNQYTLRVGRGLRDKLRTFLNERNIGAEIYYPLPLDEQPCFDKAWQGPDSWNTRTLAKEALSIPVFPELTRQEQDEAIEALLAFAEQNA